GHVAGRATRAGVVVVARRTGEELARDPGADLVLAGRPEGAGVAIVTGRAVGHALTLLRPASIDARADELPVAAVALRAGIAVVAGGARPGEDVQTTLVWVAEARPAGVRIRPADDGGATTAGAGLADGAGGARVRVARRAVGHGREDAEEHRIAVRPRRRVT